MANGDLRAFFQNGVPFQAEILNTPLDLTDQLHADIGHLRAGRRGRCNRLTLNYGARWEYFAHGIPEETSPAGRFTAARTFGPIDMPTWKSIVAAVRRGLRPVRQPEDRAQVQHRQVHAGRVHRASPKPTTRWR